MSFTTSSPRQRPWIVSGSRPWLEPSPPFAACLAEMSTCCSSLATDIESALTPTRAGAAQAGLAVGDTAPTFLPALEGVAKKQQALQAQIAHLQLVCGVSATDAASLRPNSSTSTSRRLSSSGDLPPRAADRAGARTSRPQTATSPRLPPRFASSMKADGEGVHELGLRHELGYELVDGGHS